MILRSVQYCDENADDKLSVMAVCGRGLRIRRTGDQEGTCEVANGGYDDAEVVAAVPKTVVGGLIAENLRADH